jgi:hypothetical protein
MEFREIGKRLEELIDECLEENKIIDFAIFYCEIASDLWNYFEAIREKLQNEKGILADVLHDVYPFVVRTKINSNEKYAKEEHVKFLQSLEYPYSQAYLWMVLKFIKKNEEVLKLAFDYDSHLLNCLDKTLKLYRKIEDAIRDEMKDKSLH